MTTDCTFASMGGLQHAGHVWDLGCSSLAPGRSTAWLDVVCQTRGSWCTGRNGWDCRLFLVSLVLQTQLSPAPWVANLWLRRADVHARTHTHTRSWSSAQRTSRSTRKLSSQPFHYHCIALCGREQGKMLLHYKTTAISHFQSHPSQVFVLAVHGRIGRS